MAYEPVWWRLSEAVARVVEASGCAQGEAQTDLCKAIEDGSVKFRCKLGEHMYGQVGPDKMFGGEAFDLPREIRLQGFDWEYSKPEKAWMVQRGYHSPCGSWSVDLIEVFGLDVMKALCPGLD